MSTSFVFSLHRSIADLSPRSLASLLLSLFLFVLSVSPPESNSRSICDLEGFRAEAGHYGPLSRLSRTREHRKSGSYLIRGEVYSPVDSNWARNHRALLFSVRTLKKTLTNSRFLAYYCRTESFRPSVKRLLLLPLGSLATNEYHSKRIRHLRNILHR